MDDDERLYNVGALVHKEIKLSIEACAKRMNVSRSDIIRFALVAYLKDELLEIKEESK